MPFFGAVGVFSKLVAYFLGVEAPVAANEFNAADALSALISIIDGLEKKIKAVKGKIAESDSIESECCKLCSEIEARVGELKKELALVGEDNYHINSSECKIAEIMSDIEKFLDELEKQLMEEEEEEDE